MGAVLPVWVVTAATVVAMKLCFYPGQLGNKVIFNGAEVIGVQHVGADCSQQLEQSPVAGQIAAGHFRKAEYINLFWQLVADLLLIGQGDDDMFDVIVCGVIDQVDDHLLKPSAAHAINEVCYLASHRLTAAG